jgi:5-methylcytosine-specific restriction enzyme subunit McrC
LDWVDPSLELALRVEPKLPRLDYHAMFKACLDSPVAAAHLGQAYAIRPWERFIPCQDERHDFTPYLLHHFLAVLDRLTRRPLKKGYLSKDENLQSKIKGKVLLSEHIKTNVLGRQPTMIYCGYEDFTTDCLENRLLHTAYRISLDSLQRWQSTDMHHQDRVLRYEAIATAFRDVGRLDPFHALQGIRANPVYRDYDEALRLAKLICRIQGYRDRHGEDRLVPPYLIDMPKLFELYVYQLLDRVLGERILYQSKGRYGYTDFLDIEEKLVLDAKYKPSYLDAYKIEDIRQVAGYARDLGVLHHLGLDPEDEFVVPCLIIYPNQHPDVPSQFDSTYASNRVRLTSFKKMWKLAIRLPETGLA